MYERERRRGWVHVQGSGTPFVDPGQDQGFCLNPCPCAPSVYIDFSRQRVTEETMAVRGEDGHSWEDGKSLARGGGAPVVTYSCLIGRAR